ncbi:HD domain-containing protein [Plebeiibacterium sediminum]|uniref:HD domain-containing protein n=1 Tax=Plebeiibacterium sediminum TaxID=2992112 RepID=A0AAE3M2M5_9BACT|nr:HD domain-containing protein [Plebeiobacterium sediminum]MCW3786131.1 HD domain-containing protein [Plebeiobacterium sediminum]
MNQQYSDFLRQISDYVNHKMESVDAGHDVSHINRVLHNAKEINKKEKADEFFVEAGVLLHDITDEKLFDKDQAEKELMQFLQGIGMSPIDIDRIQTIISVVSFGKEFDKKSDLTPEQKVVCDADRLDAIGAIGIARTFHYGGNKNREIFNQSIPPKKYNSTEEYRNSESPTINHFYEKLLLLKDKMETETGKALANDRHQFMLNYLKQFYNEIGVDGF